MLKRLLFLWLRGRCAGMLYPQGGSRAICYVAYCFRKYFIFLIFIIEFSSTFNSLPKIFKFVNRCFRSFCSYSIIFIDFYKWAIFYGLGNWPLASHELIFAKAHEHLSLFRANKY